jgi:hypothetical protein
MSIDAETCKNGRLTASNCEIARGVIKTIIKNCIANRANVISVTLYEAVNVLINAEFIDSDMAEISINNMAHFMLLAPFWHV